MVFDVRLFGLLFAACVIAVAVSVPSQVRALRAVLGIAVPPEALLLWGIAQQLVLAAAAAATGVLLAPRVGLGAPCLQAVLGSADPLPILVRQVAAAVPSAVVVLLGLLVLYYGLFRPRLRYGDVVRMERLRLGLGLPARMLQGGVLEEVIFRWGVMTLAAWVGVKVTGEASSGVLWTSVVAAALVFGLSHLPGALQLGLERSPMVIASLVVVNLWGGLVFGRVYWRHGLLAAILSHALVHAFWRSFEARLLDQLIVKSRDAV